MLSVLDFLERTIGPILFALGITIFIISFSVTENYLDTSKGLYLEGPVYSAGKYDDEYSNDLKKEELLAMIINGVEYPVTIKSKDSTFLNVVTVEPLGNSLYHVKIEDNQTATPDAELNTLFDDNVYTFQGFRVQCADGSRPLDYFIQNDEYEYNTLFDDYKVVTGIEFTGKEG